MRADRLTLRGFRNLQESCCVFDPGVNIVYGENAQGKTNFLEAVWLFTGGKSFRGAKDKELISFYQDAAFLELNFFAEERDQQATIAIRGRRMAELNGIKQATPARMAGKFCAVVFSPAHLSLIKDGPEERRRFMDGAICQLRPSYIRDFSTYQRTLKQRNALLKEAQTGATLSEEILEVWDARLAQAGAAVFAARRRYWNCLQPAASAVYDGLSSGREQMTLAYDSCAGDEKTPLEQVSQRLLTLLKERRRVDRAAGFTTAGVHRDDLVVSIGGQSARAYGSQGQQRSAVLALKLAEASLLKQETGEQPVMLLDDVMSELDPSRQDYILNHIHGWQVLITCCDPAPIRRLTKGSAFEMQAGKIVQKDG